MDIVVEKDLDYGGYKASYTNSLYEINIIVNGETIETSVGLCLDEIQRALILTKRHLGTLESRIKNKEYKIILKGSDLNV